jgi:hypothetical protein
MRLPSLLLAPIVLAAALLAPGEAAASKIVYSCAPELCVVDPDTGVSATLTTDGAADPYRHPAITRDGTTIAAERGSNTVHVGPYGGNVANPVAGTRDMNDVAIAPDGSGVAESHSYVENRYGCPLTGGCLELVDRSGADYTSLGAAPVNQAHPGGGGVGFLGGALLSSRYTLNIAMHTVCIFEQPAADDAPCIPRIMSPNTLSSPDGSPDGRLIAVTVGDPEPATTSSVRIYDAATGAALRTLAQNAGGPSFSPDGRQVAFSSDGWIHVVPVTGGTPRRVVQGVTPAWGDGNAPGPHLRSTALRHRNGRIPVRVLCEGTATCAGTVRLKKGSATLGARSYRVAGGKAKTVVVRPTTRGRRTIARSRTHAITVELRPRNARAATTKAKLRR